MHTQKLGENYRERIRQDHPKIKTLMPFFLFKIFSPEVEIVLAIHKAKSAGKVGQYGVKATQKI